MIYFISNQIRLFESNNIQKATVQDCLNYCNNLEIIGLDTETTGFDPYDCKVLLLQLGDYNNQYVIDASIDYTLFKLLIESKPIIGQNIKFDLKFLYRMGIYPTNVYDTFLAESKLYQGIQGIYKNLGALNERYLGTQDVDKSLRILVNKGITDKVIKYAANDVKPLEKIMNKQLLKAKELGLIEAIRLENNFVLTLAYIEYCGMYVNQEKWIKKVNQRKLLLKKSLNFLNKYILDNNFINYIEAQLDLFSNEKKITINWNSDKQVKKFFKELGINIKIVEKGIEKESVDAKVLLPQKDKFEILPLYLQYKKWEKDLSTYGDKFLTHINKTTGRIHTQFRQIVDTGRMSSGGKDKATGKENINFQNIPADSETRTCFTNQYETTTLINCDYSGMEQVVLANKSQDKDLLHFYKQNLGDMHSYIASKIYPELKDLNLNTIKKDHKDKRQIAKSAGFALNYGGTGFTIAKNLSIDISQGAKVEKAYFEAFPGLKDFYDIQEKEALNKGYILIDTITGSKFFIAEYNRFLKLHEKFKFDDNRIYWQKYKKEKLAKTVWFYQQKEEVSYYFRWKSQIRRNALNFPIQGSSASITKIAGIHFFRWIKKNNLLNKVLISNVIHDEYLIECPINIAKEAALNLKNYMEKAGSFYCKTVPLKAEPEITNVWGH